MVRDDGSVAGGGKGSDEDPAAIGKSTNEVLRFRGKCMRAATHS